MSKPRKPASNTKTPNPTNPSSLAPRYSIRKLGPEHIPWACAVMAHSHAFHSTIWHIIHPTLNLGAWCRTLGRTVTYLVTHQINSGLSYGVFDDEYEYVTEEARATGGKLYWDEAEESLEVTRGVQGREEEGMRLEKQMDFNLVSIALSYDCFVPLDMEKMRELDGSWPEMKIVFGTLARLDPRDPVTWKATTSGQVLMRNATSTRHSYEGRGLVGGTARWLMREMAGKGFRAVQIECVNDAVTWTWSGGVEEPFRAEVISEFQCNTLELEDGSRPFERSGQRVTKCYVDLKAEEKSNV